MGSFRLGVAALLAFGIVACHDDAAVAPDLADLSIHDDLSVVPPPDLADPGPAPPLRVTVNALPDTMNGKLGYTDGAGAHAFVLRVPTAGFTVDYYVAGGQPDAGIALEPASFGGRVSLTASVALTIGGTPVAAGDDLVPHLACEATPDAQGWPDEARFVRRCLVATTTVAAGVTFTAQLHGSGATTTTDQITVDVVTMPATLDPFVTEDTWLVTLSRDLFAHSLAKNSDGSFTVTADYLPAGNGVSDLDEALTLLGLRSTDATVSAAFKADFLARVRAEATRIFGDARVRLVFEGDAGAPLLADWSASADFSVIAIGGDPDPDGIANKYVGRAHLDPNNQGHENDATYGFGIFTTSMVRQILSNSLGALLVKEFSPIDGIPLGQYTGDALIVDPTYTPAADADTRHRLRANALKTIRQYLPMAVASTLCHEIGHSLGLVANGAPPLGLFGGMDGLTFTKSDAGDWHIDTPGLNVMQTGRVTDYGEVLSGQVPRFNQLNMAYLRRRLVIGNLE